MQLNGFDPMTLGLGPGQNMQIPGQAPGGLDPNQGASLPGVGGTDGQDPLLDLLQPGQSSEEILDKLSETYDEEIDIAVQKMTSVLEPILILAMAGVVGFIVIAVLLPMLELSTDM